MELVKCLLCDGQLSSGAKTCPACGNPNTYCPHCKGMSAIKGMKFDMQFDSQMIGYGPLILLLLGLGIVPGIFAIFYLKNVPYCPDCKKLIWERRPF
jgi:hypothetical protein